MSLATEEGESAPMDIDFQPKKSSSPKRRLTQSEKAATKILQNQWWPFERADGKLLERLHKQHVDTQLGEALL